MWKDVMSKIMKMTKKSDVNMIHRWMRKSCLKQEEMAIYNANRDNCGDKICGDVKEYMKKKEELFNQRQH